ncbi:ribokinase-like [Agrilus planipennis]|uniref:Ribokinase n=1 Tax=Agrilus planipennis TaxID=224129 RepID=A0A1W4WQ76_AGRPL|nr:ribokinase-like [Agrilus planipennis]XP_018322191.1 ribokinase-like [Agrilus planipennis]
MSSNNYVFGAGACAVDHVCLVPRLPEKGETLLGTKYWTQFGGKGSNACVTVCKLGGRASFLGRVGDDSWAEKFIDSLEENKVDCHVIKTPGVHTGTAFINLTTDGENQIIGVLGANNKVSVDDVDNVKELIQNAVVVVCSLEFPNETAIKILESSRRSSILIAAPSQKNLNPALFTLPTIFCVNQTEAEVYSGIKINDISDLKLAVYKLLEKGCNIVIITLGVDGAIYASRNVPTPVHVMCPEVECVDSTGAGDAFVGVLAYLMAYKRHLSLKEMVEAACHCAAYTVCRKGSQSAMPDESVLNEFLDSKITSVFY